MENDLWAKAQSIGGWREVESRQFPEGSVLCRFILHKNGRIYCAGWFADGKLAMSKTLEKYENENS